MADGSFTFTRNRRMSLSDCHASPFEDDFLEPYVCGSGPTGGERPLTCSLSATSATLRSVSTKSLIVGTKSSGQHHVVRRMILT